MEERTRVHRQLQVFPITDVTDNNGLTPALIANKFHLEKLKQYLVKHRIASNSDAVQYDIARKKMLKPDTLSRSVFTSLYVNELASSFYCGQLEGGSCLLDKMTEKGRPDNAKKKYRHDIGFLNLLLISLLTLITEGLLRATTVDDTNNEMRRADDEYGVIRAAVIGDVVCVKKWLNGHKRKPINVKHVALVMREAARNGRDVICKLMIDSGQVSNSIISYALPIACSHGHLSTAKLIIQQRPVTNKILTEALSGAALYGHRQIVSWLVTLTCVMNLLSNSSMKWRLIVACANGDIDDVKQLTKCVDSDSVIYQALRVACHNSEHSVVKWLTSHTKADASKAGVVKTFDGRVTSLMAACDSGYTRIAIQLLQCVTPHTVNMTSEVFHDTALHYTIWSEPFFNTRLHHACNDGDANAVHILLDECNIDVQDHYGYTPLHYACQNGHLKIIKLLLSVFADYSATDNEGLTPVMTADKYEQAEVVEYFLKFFIDDLRDLTLGGVSEKVLFNVVKKKLKLDALEQSYGASLHLSETFADACYCGQRDMVHWMLDHTSIDCNMSVNGSNTALHNVIWNSIWPDYGQTPLHEACIVGDVAEVDRLRLMDEFNEGDVNVQDNDGNTPLHLACYKGYSEIVKILVLEQADLTITNHLNMTPTQVATDQQHGELLEFLDKKRLLDKPNSTKHVPKLVKLLKYLICSKPLQNALFSRVISSARLFGFPYVSRIFSKLLHLADFLSKLRQLVDCYQANDFTEKYFANETRRYNIPSSAIFRPQSKVRVCPARLFTEKTICPIEEISPATSRKQNYSPKMYFTENALRRLAFDRRK